MHIETNISLKTLNTFGIDVKAKHFVSIHSVSDLQTLLRKKEYPKKLILGGGSNMLLTKDVDALVILIDIKGIEVIKETPKGVWVKVCAGENWHDFVLYTIDHDFGGLENLSLIPGNVGTAPIQNIGAYGVELKDTFRSCDAVHVETGKVKTFYKEDCDFGYRDSVFKSQLKGQYIITSVVFELSKEAHVLKTTYGAISSQLEQRQISNPSLKDVSEAVIAIRQSKLPDPKKIGNSGSFFKNPIISIAQLEKLRKSFEGMPSYPISDTEVKVPAGWLIEHAGFKGKTFGNYGVHKNQALVLVNYGGATGLEILGLARLIQNTISRLYGIDIEAEVNVI
ncbi:UDP-N-acetylmuramate dehydrogenase [Subsaximicrobium wynnwilliamsii]|uniref:UDP-N-acetylenolpyruvoylglucosamine reductase n=1 Tax=Subsaximicrobium wynnwilliamsii TaxID=291179 RepID=A0A5C6ZJX9_9FLAO|nr:UDP-N-acetylmuramate dehydrogenase [Subsaximicrobium wynnwilliamsii]TXD84584.1 UDP-N-acetylmuramate dehydrogenase [Subsaximicrobium wynnwilliamsii]TXD90266.1 UDP-N-acetylmuramate dehydrogenase [Subsaximicrobium wynnwilliamsii]TXE04317.1 UDP-N-acetylmuramate dehydrogenase [Subsaximicrobium wynnwilliamsii]